MELTLLDRLTLLGMLPPEGDLRTMKVVHELRQDLAPTADEIEQWEVKDVEVAEGKHSVAWNDEKAEAIDIDVAGVKTQIIVEALRKLDAEKKVGPQHLPLCDKFPIDAKD